MWFYLFPYLRHNITKILRGCHLVSFTHSASKDPIHFGINTLFLLNCLFLSSYISIYPSLSVTYITTYLYLPVYLFMSTYKSTYMSLSVYLDIYMSVSFCLSSHLPICFFRALRSPLPACPGQVKNHHGQAKHIDLQLILRNFMLHSQVGQAKLATRAR